MIPKINEKRLWSALLTHFIFIWDVVDKMIMKCKNKRNNKAEDPVDKVKIS